MKTHNHWVELGSVIGVLIFTSALMLLWPGLAKNLFVANGFIPHGHCYLWKPELVALHLISDLLIGLAYVAISVMLAYLVHKAWRNIPFQGVFLAFGLFIITCGSTHLMEVWTLWKPLYWLSGEIKLITAIASVATALILPPLIPQVLSLVETAKLSDERKHQLETANRELEALYEKLIELDHLKTQFFANVSHELRTPLALILGPTQKLLASDELTAKHHQDLQVVNRNAQTLLKQVNDLLDVAKLDAGKMELQYADVNLAQVVRLCASHFEAIAQERQISFVIETPASLPAQIDPEKIQRVCFNLLSNAFKFTPVGGEIRLQLKPEQNGCEGNSQSKINAILQVEDSGSGVAPELRQVIFEPFQQGETIATERALGGTGLGLAIVKEFIALHGGAIAVGDATAGGARFTIQLPLLAPAGVPINRSIESDVNQVLAVLAELRHSHFTPELAQPPVSPSDAPLVLVVEDNPEMNQFIAEALAIKYRVATAFNGQEGLEKARQLKPDLILSDVMMPQMSGDQMVQQLRTDQELDNTAIVMLTAKVDDHLRIQLLREGVQDYLMKPFSLEELKVRVGNLIAMQQARAILAERTAELQAANESLRQSESTLRSFYNSASMMMGIVELAENDIVHISGNAATAQLFGLTPEIMQHKIHPSQNKLPNWMPQYQQAASTQAPVRFEYRHQTAEGEVWLAATVCPIANSPSNYPRFAYIAEDISERQAALRDRKREQERLLLLESAVVNANDAIVITDTASIDEAGPRIIYVNDAFTRMTGYKLQEVLGKTPRILQGPNSDRNALAKIRTALRNCHPIVVELTNYRKDGSEFWVEISIVPIINATDQHTHWVAIQRDITERKQAEEERTQLIQERAARAISEAARHAAEMSQQRFAFLAEASAVLASSLDPEIILTNLAYQTVPFLADWCIVYILKPEGAIYRLAFAHTDLAKEELLRQLEDASGNVIDPNQSHPVLEVLITSQSLFYANWSDAPPDFKCSILDFGLELTENASENHSSPELPHPLQSQWQTFPLPQSVMFVPLISQGKTQGVIGFAVEESERRYSWDDVTLAEDLAHRTALAIEKARLYQEAQEANRMKDEFLAVLSHELRTPINAIQGWAHLLRTRKFDATTTERALETIERNARNQTQMIEDLLDVSRIIRGKLQLSVHPLPIIPLIEAAIHTLIPASEAKNIRLICHLNPLGGLVSGDADRLQQIIWNLLSNAIKFTPSGGLVEVKLSKIMEYDQESKAIPLAEIMVRDTGKGINSQFLPYVFDRFRQENSSSTRAYGGLGLGLAIVRHLVELQGGSVGVQSPGEGLGATFTVRLPLLQEEGDRGESDSVSLHSPPLLTGLRVLVVDDEADARDMLTTILGGYGAETIAVASAKDALLAMAQLPDILVSDIAMPGEDGYSLMRQLTQLMPRQKIIPAIALTAYAREEDRQRAIAVGFQEHLSKPVSPILLVETVARLAKLQDV